MSLSLLIALSTGCVLRIPADWDRDGDGLERWQDCDDDDASVGQLSWFLDADGDGFGAGAEVVSCDPPSANYVVEAGDCADGNADQHPDAPEVCNGVDDDCDGATDDDDQIDDPSAPTWYRDGDNDSYGDPEDSVVACQAPAGFVDRGGDCDDMAPTVNPDGTESCDPDDVDEDCDGFPDNADPEGAEGTSRFFADADGDGFGDPAAGVQLCEKLDGFVANKNDCDDVAPETNPDALEICADGIDNDCDTVTACEFDVDDATGTLGTSAIEMLNLGTSLATVQDSGGGEDLVVGDNRYSPTGASNSGAFFVFDDLELGTTSAEAQVAVVGPARQDQVGFFLAGADNRLAVGAIYGGSGNEGVVQVYVNGVDEAQIVGDDGNDEFGAAVAWGDATGSGQDQDLAVGSRKQSSGAGVIYLFSGPAIQDAEAVDLASAAIVGEAVNDQIGKAVAWVDGNGDGQDDVIFGSFAHDVPDSGAFNQGKYYAVLNPSGPTLAQNADQQQAGAEGDKLGGQVASVGDLTGDGYEEGVVCALQGTDTLGDQGYCTLALGSPSDDKALALADMRIWGDGAGDSLGSGRVWNEPGDVNGDGQDDLIISSLLVNSGAGAVYIFTGPLSESGSFAAGDADVVVSGDPASEFGESFVVTDLNGDKDLELVVGASAINTVYLFDLNEWF